MKITSLHIRVSLSVAAAALLLVLGSSYFFYQNIYQNSLSESHRSVEQLLETVREPAAIAAYVSNRELAQQVVEGLVQNDIVVGADISAGGELIGHQGKTAAEQGENISLELKSPFVQDETVGELSVAANLPLIALRARQTALANTTSLATLAAFVALLVMLMVYWMMSRPLSRLSRHLHQITPGDGSRLNLLGSHRGDEIGLLVSDINSLLTTVETRLDEERQLRRRVELLETRFRGLFEDSSAGIFLVQDNGLLVTANPAFYRLTQIAEDREGQPHIVEQVFAKPEQVSSLLKLALISKRPCSGDFLLKSTPGATERWLHCIFSPSGSDNEKKMVEGVMYDITQRKLSEENNRRLAEKDSLTGLANRQAIESAIQTQIQQAEFLGKGFVLLMIDLDRFKHINDTYGHNAGDLVLQQVARRLQQQVRDSDLVARLGGDEFLILLKNTDHISRAETIAKAILSNQRPIEIQPGIMETLGMSIGIAHYPEHGDSDTALRKHADQAMYAVKRQGKNGYAIYQQEAEQSLVQRTQR